MTQGLFGTTLISLLLLCGCSGDNPADTEKTPPSGTTETLSLTAAVQSGTTETLLAEGTRVGLLAETQAGVLTRNKLYTSKGSTLEAGNGELPVPGEETLVLYGYAPYSPDGITEGSLLAFSTRADQQADGTVSSELLWGNVSVRRGTKSAKLPLSRLTCRIRIHLQSPSGSELDGARVEITEAAPSGQVDLSRGEVVPDYKQRSPIRARSVGNGYYEVIILPQSLQAGVENPIRVTIDGKTFSFAAADGVFETGKEYDFDLQVDYTPPKLDFSITVAYDGKTLGDALSVGAVVADKPLALTASPVHYNVFKVRNQDGGHCWASINGPYSSTPDRISHQEPFINLRFEENLGPQRTMMLEFYDADKPADVYKRVTITQAAAVDYLTLSTQSLSPDRFGTIYDTPFEVAVHSNLDWTADASDTWIKHRYTPGEKNQTVQVSVEENTTGAPRSATLSFMSGGKAVKAISVNQSATENSSFTVKYELNIDFESPSGFFRYYHTLSEQWFYPDICEIFNHYPSEYGDETAKLKALGSYGFVTDPGTFSHVSIKGFSHDKFFNYRGYRGNAVTQRERLTLGNSRIGYPFYRGFDIDLNIPAGVKRSQKVIFHVRSKDSAGSITPDQTTVTSEVVDQ